MLKVNLQDDHLFNGSYYGKDRAKRIKMVNLVGHSKMRKHQFIKYKTLKKNYPSIKSLL